MRGLVYPYYVRLRYSGGADMLPLILCKVRSAAGDVRSLLGLLDSGAEVTLLPKTDAKELGIALERGIPAVVGGVAGEEVKGWRHRLIFILGTEEFSTPVVFAERDDIPRVLGREEIFDKFFVVFDEKKKRLALISRERNTDLFFEEKLFTKLKRHKQ